MPKSSDSDRDVAVANETTKGADANHSTWYYIGRFAGKKPILFTTIVLILGTVIATLLGLTPWDVWSVLAVGLAVLGIVALFAYAERGGEPGSKKPKKDRSSDPWSVSLGTVVVVLVVHGYLSHQRDRNFPHWKDWREKMVWQGAPHDSSKPSGINQVWKIPAASENYWQLTVVPLHHFRFGTAYEDDTPFNQVVDEHRRKFRDAVEKAKKASSQNVDPDLVKMVQRHHAIDESELRLFDQGKALYDKQGITPTTAPAGKWTRAAEEIFGNMTDEQFGKLPPEFQEYFSQLAELQDASFAQLREIEIMQARLSERYSGRNFPLPTLDGKSPNGTGQNADGK